MAPRIATDLPAYMATPSGGGDACLCTCHVVVIRAKCDFVDRKGRGRAGTEVDV